MDYIDYAALLASSSTNTILTTDQVIVVRAGVPRPFNGTLFAIDAAGRLSFSAGATSLGVNRNPISSVAVAAVAPNSSNLAAALMDNAGNHAITIQLDTSSRNRIVSDYFGAGPRRALALSGSGSDDVVLGTDGSLSITSATTASAANLYQSATGAAILRSTSSLRYKRDVETLAADYADKLLSLRPIWYRSTASADNPEWGYYGFAAEEVAAVDPRLVHWGYQEDQYEMVEVEPAVRARKAVRAGGEIVTPAVKARPARRELRLKEGAERRPDGVQYERIVVGLTDIVRRQGEQIAALSARLDASQ